MRPALETKLSDASALNGMAVGEPLLVDAALIARAPKLEVVFIGAAGYDRIDTAAARRHPRVQRAGSSADVVAEHTLGLMLALSRHRGFGSSGACHRQDPDAPDIQTSGWSLGMLKGRTLGLLGFGFVGQQVAQRALLGFGMNVIAYDPFFDKEEARRQGVTLFDTPDAVCAQADVLSLHVPLTEQTRNLVDSRMLSLMKNSAFLINTARGASVDTEALVDALRARRIAAAALDVTEPEPLPEGHALFALENAIVTPHIAGTAPETFAKSAVIAAELAIKGLRGERSPHLVNPDAWKRNRERFGQAGS
jgi:phosphoglycerate dehydrogenase-like enzyme